MMYISISWYIFLKVFFHSNGHEWNDQENSNKAKIFGQKLIFFPYFPTKSYFMILVESIILAGDILKSCDTMQ